MDLLKFQLDGMEWHDDDKRYFESPPNAMIIGVRNTGGKYQDADIVEGFMCRTFPESCVSYGFYFIGYDVAEKEYFSLGTECYSCGKATTEKERECSFLLQFAGACESQATEFFDFVRRNPTTLQVMAKKKMHVAICRDCLCRAERVGMNQPLSQNN